MTKTPGNQKKRKPLRRAQHWLGQVPPMAAKLAAALVAIVVMGMMFSALQAIESTVLRGALSLLIASGLLLLCVNEGMTRGTADAANSRSYAAALEKGTALDARDDAQCYQPLKAVCAALLVFGVPLALSVFVAVTAKPYTYTLQDLPVWLTDSYGARGDVMAPLGAYARQTSLAAADWVRLIVRLPEMIYINVFPDPQRMSALIDRLSPLMLATFPLAYVIGYLCGPRLNRKRERMNRRAKKVAVRKAEKSTLAQELTGAQPQVHYGQRAQSDQPKKKELV
ncbi:MAG: hypothetical protein ACI4PG_01395 [Candidatus Ventricola sp.]